jgi:uncharacterized membrane protein YagU involved in acid resistance
MKQIATGAVAGLVATAAMTAVMTSLFRMLPRRDRYPLPPVEIVSRLIGRRASPAVSLLAHFAYGALTGALWGRLRTARLAAGAAYGLAVWGASYLGWLPALGILKPATRHPPARNALMLLAHLAWGATLAAATRRLK